MGTLGRSLARERLPPDVDPSTSSPPESRASRRQSQGTERAPQMTDGSGPLSLELFDTPDPDGSWARTYLASLSSVLTGWTGSSVSWRQRAISAARSCWVLMISARRISGSGSGSCVDGWKTPASADAGVDVGRLVDAEGNDWQPGRRAYDRHNGRLCQTGLIQEVGAQWQSPMPSDVSGGRTSKGSKRPSETGLRMQANWPTVHGQGEDGHGSELSQMARNGSRRTENWTTPTAGDSNASRSAAYSTESGRHAGRTLTDCVKQLNWPTARAEDSEQTGAHRGVPDTLTSAARAWRTPDASIVSGGAQDVTDRAGHAIGLHDQVHSWPTPRESEHKGTGPLDSKSHKHRLERCYLDATVQEAEQRTGSLNPAWVEQLMGYPDGWTDPMEGGPYRLVTSSTHGKPHEPSRQEPGSQTEPND